MLPTPRFLNKQQTVSAVLQDVAFYTPSFVIIPTPFDYNNVYFQALHYGILVVMVLTEFVHRVRIFPPSPVDILTDGKEERGNFFYFRGFCVKRCRINTKKLEDDGQRHPSVTRGKTKKF